MLSTPAVIGSKAKLVAPPGQPQNLVLTSNNASNTFTADWNAVSGADGYYIEWRVDGGSWIFPAKTSSTNSYTSPTQDAFSNCDYVEVRIRAYNSGGTSSYSAIKGIYIDCTPSTPTGLSVWESGIRSWSASWNSVSGATGYKIRNRVNAGSWSFEELVAGTSYSSMLRYDPCDYVEVQVAAYGTGGTSAWSATQATYIDCI